MTKNLKNIRYDPIPFDENIYKIKVKKELSQGREINALLLIHTYIESYLTDWLFLLGDIQKDNLSKNIIDYIDHINFKTLLTIHLILGTIDQKLYEKINGLNEFRNDYAHKLSVIPFEESRIKTKINNVVKYGIATCDEVVSLYKQKLEERALIYLKCPKCDSGLERKMKSNIESVLKCTNSICDYELIQSFKIISK